MNEKDFYNHLEKINIYLNDKQKEQFKIYLKHLQKRGKEYNLTSLLKTEEIYLKHFYDSLLITQFYDFKKINSLADLGTGGGFPGIPLKIIYPHLEVFLVDSNNKKIRFLNEVIELLNLKKIRAKKIRIEEIKRSFDVVIGRAVGSISYLSELSIRLFNKNLLLMRGKEEEISKRLLKELNLKVVGDYKYKLDIENSDRRLLVFEKTKEVSKKYPRKHSLIKKELL